MNEDQVPYVTSNESKREFKLPRINYGPICNRILHEFIIYHRLPNDLTLPSRGLRSVAILENILDIMLHSMGNEKRDLLLKETEDYMNSLPPSLRD